MVGESSCTLIQYISIYFYRHWYVLLFSYHGYIAIII